MKIKYKNFKEAQCKEFMPNLIQRLIHRKHLQIFWAWILEINSDTHWPSPARRIKRKGARRGPPVWDQRVLFHCTFSHFSSRVLRNSTLRIVRPLVGWLVHYILLFLRAVFASKCMVSHLYHCPDHLLATLVAVYPALFHWTRHSSIRINCCKSSDYPSNLKRVKDT